MNNKLVFKNELDNNIILKTLHSGIKFGSKTDIELFIFYFLELYKNSIFNTLLKTILTKIKKGQTIFKLIQLKDWDRIAGHCTTTVIKDNGEESLFKNTIFSRYYTIIIKKISPDIIIHEIAHAIEYESRIDLNNGFRQIISKDFKDNKTNILNLKIAVKNIIQEQLKNYKLKHYMSEIFARFFELIALSKEIGGWSKYEYRYDDVVFYFSNTIEYIENSLFPILNKKVNINILKQSANLINNLEPYKKQWTKKFHSKFENLTEKDKIHQQLFDDQDGCKIILATNLKTEFDKHDKCELDDGTRYIKFFDNINKLSYSNQENMEMEKIES